jgi:hypothetical protein
MNHLSYKGLILAALMAYLSCSNAAAQTVNIGGQTCTQNYSLYDYYSNGEYNFSSWEPDGVDCFDFGGDYSYSDPGIIGGGGTGGSGSDVQAVAGYPGRTVSLDGKKIYARDVACGGEGQDVLRVQAAHHALIPRPNMALNTIVTVYLFEGKSQTFRRVATSGSAQFAPNGACQ